MIVLKFLQSFRGVSKGEVLGVSESEAEYLIKNNIAVKYVADEEPAEDSEEDSIEEDEVDEENDKEEDVDERETEEVEMVSKNTGLNRQMDTSTPVVERIPWFSLKAMIRDLSGESPKNKKEAEKILKKFQQSRNIKKVKEAKRLMKLLSL